MITSNRGLAMLSDTHPVITHVTTLVFVVAAPAALIAAARAGAGRAA